MKKIKIFLITYIIFLFLFNTLSFATEEQIIEENEDELALYSEYAVLMEMNTGKIIYEKNMNERLYPASITKILTAILTIENCKLDEIATASEYAVNSIPKGYTLAGIKPEEQFTVEQLLEVMMLRSANEAATILAEHVSGSVEEFSKLMNKKAKEIGCLDSNFLNANGMHDDNHYSTAYDMALIQRYCMKNEEYRRISSLQECTLPNTDLYTEETRTFKNTHAFLIPSDKNYYKYAISGKTGYTTPAKNCLVTSANKDGFELISAIFHAEGKVDGISSRYLDSKKLLDYGFNNYRISNLFKEGSVIKTIRINTEEGTKEKLELLLQNTIDVVCLKNENINKKDGEIKLNNLNLPIQKGDILGIVTYKINNEEYTSNLIAGSSIEGNEIITDIQFEEKNSENSNIIFLLIILFVCLVIIVFIFILVMIKERKATYDTEVSR